MAELNDTLSARSRPAGNKGVARKLRRAGWVPAVAYGSGQAPRYLALTPKDFLLQRRHYGLSHIYPVTVEDGGQFKALIKEVQSDPVTRQLLHIDLHVIDLNKPIRVVVPLELVGKPAGLVDGGLLSQVLRSTEVYCLPNDVPAKISADVSALKIGDSLHLSDLQLPQGVKLTAQGDEAIALVVEPEAAPTATTPEAAAAAPAAAGATPAAKTAAKPADKK